MYFPLSFWSSSSSSWIISGKETNFHGRMSLQKEESAELSSEKNMIINNKLRTLFVLALYIGFTIAIYAIVCHFLKIEFQDIHLLYAVLVGCVAYLPRFIAEKKSKK